MIRIIRVYDINTDSFRKQEAALKDLFRRIFVREPDEAEGVLRAFGGGFAPELEPYLYVAHDGRNRLIGLALAVLHSRTRIAYLDFIGSHPDYRHKGIGGSLYEVLRDGLRQGRCVGMMLEVPPDDAELVRDGARLENNERRLKFYESVAAFPLDGLPWDNPGRRDYDRPFLVWDGLGAEKLPAAGVFLDATKSFLDYKYPGKGSAKLLDRIRVHLEKNRLRRRPARYIESKRPSAGKTAGHSSIVVAYASGHAIHHVRERGFAERPVRVSAIREALADMKLREIETKKFAESIIRLVHSPHYLKFMKDTVDGMSEDAFIYPQIFPVRRPEKKPRELAMRLGYYCSDTFTPLSRGAYAAARSSFDTALTVAAQVASGARAAYAVCRPPGHHAERSLYGGFCYFNNAAGAAQFLSAKGKKVAVLDIDYHHGNGMQEIFYERADVLTVSIHGHPSDHYPYFSGYEDELGLGLGLGYNRNFAVKAVTGDEAYLKILKSALREIRTFDPHFLVVALGLDIMKGDPTGNFGISAPGMEAVARLLRETGRPLCIIQEGGYRIRNLHSGIRAFIGGLA